MGAGTMRRARQRAVGFMLHLFTFVLGGEGTAATATTQQGPRTNGNTIIVRLGLIRWHVDGGAAAAGEGGLPGESGVLRSCQSRCRMREVAALVDCGPQGENYQKASAGTRVDTQAARRRVEGIGLVRTLDRQGHLTLGTWDAERQISMLTTRVVDEILLLLLEDTVEGQLHGGRGAPDAHALPARAKDDLAYGQVGDVATRTGCRRVEPGAHAHNGVDDSVQAAMDLHAVSWLPK